MFSPMWTTVGIYTGRKSRLCLPGSSEISTVSTRNYEKLAVAGPADLTCEMEMMSSLFLKARC